MIKIFGFQIRNIGKNAGAKLIKAMAKSFFIDNTSLSQSTNEDFFQGGIEFNKTKEGEKIIFSDDKNYTVLFSGRIVGYDLERERLIKIGYKFNHRDSMAEFVLNSYLEKGLNFVKKLNGTFVFVIHDKKNSELIIVNDRYGVNSLYYYMRDNKFVFASEVKAIVKSGLIKKEINWDAWRELFALTHVLGQKTFFKDVFLLPNASVLIYKNGRAKIKRYWDYSEIKINSKISKKQYIGEASKVFKNIMGRQTDRVNKVHLLLSGGYDSRTIAICLKNYTRVKFDTYTSAFHATGDKDVQLAPMIAKAMNVKNTIVTNGRNIYRKYFINFLYYVDCMSYEHIWVMTLLRKLKHNAPDFDGLVGDTLMRGVITIPYDQYQVPLKNKDAAQQLYKNLGQWFKDVPMFFNEKFAGKLESNKVVSSIRKELEGIRYSKYKFTIYFLENKSRNTLTLIGNNLLSRKLEVYYPFFDNHFVEFFLSIPPKFKSFGSYRRILEKIDKKIMQIPSTNRGIYIRELKKRVAKLLKRVLIDYKMIKILEKIGIDLKKYRRFKFLEGFQALPLREDDIKYLIKLLNKIKIPPQINKKYLFSKLDRYLKEGKDPSYFLIPISTFCVWYNMFFVGKIKPFLRRKV